MRRRRGAEGPGLRIAVTLAAGLWLVAAGAGAQEPGLPPTNETVAIIRAEIAELEAQRQILESRIANASERMQRAVADASVATTLAVICSDDDTDSPLSVPVYCSPSGV